MSQLDSTLAGPASRSLQNVLRQALATGDEIKLITASYGPPLSGTDPDRNSHCNVVIAGVTCKIPRLATASGDSGDPAYILVTKDGLLAIGTVGDAGGVGGHIGDVTAFAGATVPADSLLCDGASYSRTTYSLLFGAIGTIWGAADAATFRVPDFRGRALYGAGNGGINLGGMFGAGASHRHTYSGNTTDTDIGHQHGLQAAIVKAINNADGDMILVQNWSGSASMVTGSAGGSHHHGASGTTSGAVQADAPAWAGVNYIIRAL